jgi:hypothetical protein
LSFADLHRLVGGAGDAVLVQRVPVCDWQGFMEGALLSGIDVAAEVLAT